MEVEGTAKRKGRKAARILVRSILHEAAQQPAMSMSRGEARAAMAISWALDRVVWRLMDQGKAVAEAEINCLVSGHQSRRGCCIGQQGLGGLDVQMCFTLMYELPSNLRLRLIL